MPRSLSKDEISQFASYQYANKRAVAQFLREVDPAMEYSEWLRYLEECAKLNGWSFRTKHAILQGIHLAYGKPVFAQAV